MTKFYSMEDFANKIKEERLEIFDDILRNELSDQLTRQIIKARIEKNITQKHLAEKAHLTQCQISRLEKGQLGTTKNLLDIITALDLDIKLVPKNSRVVVCSRNAQTKAGRAAHSPKKQITLKSTNRDSIKK